MRSKERTPFTPVDLCGLIAHETASMLYGVGADSIPSAETMRAGLETFAAAAGAVDISIHLAWIDSELESAREFERTGQDTAHLLDPGRLNAVPDAAVQMRRSGNSFVRLSACRISRSGTPCGSWPSSSLTWADCRISCWEHLCRTDSV